MMKLVRYEKLGLGYVSKWMFCVHDVLSNLPTTRSIIYTATVQTNPFRYLYNLRKLSETLNIGDKSTNQRY